MSTGPYLSELFVNVTGVRFCRDIVYMQSAAKSEPDVLSDFSETAQNFDTKFYRFTQHFITTAAVAAVVL